MRVLDIPGIVAISVVGEKTDVPINGIMIKQMMPAYRKDADSFINDIKRGNVHTPHFLVSNNGTIYQLLELDKKSRVNLNDKLKEDTERYIHIYLTGYRVGFVGADQETALITLLAKLMAVNGLAKSEVYEYYSCFLYNPEALRNGKAEKSNIVKSGSTYAYQTIDKSKLVLHSTPKVIKLKDLIKSEDVNDVFLICKLGAVSETYSWAIDRVFKYTDSQTGEVTKIDVSACYSITSGYRNPKHNAGVGGVVTSQHVRGEAIDGASNNELVPPYKLVTELKSFINSNSDKYIVGQILLEPPITETEEEARKHLEKFGELSTVFHISIPKVEYSEAIENPAFLNEIINEAKSQLVISSQGVSVRIYPETKDFKEIDTSTDVDTSVTVRATTVNDIKATIRFKTGKAVKYVSVPFNDVLAAIEKAQQDEEQARQLALQVESRDATLIASNTNEVVEFYGREEAGGEGGTARGGTVQCVTNFNARLAADIKNIVTYDFDVDDWVTIPIQSSKA